MNGIVIYLIKASVSLVFFYSLFLLFRKDTFLHIKRFYLLFSIFFSLLIPFIGFELPLQNEPLIDSSTIWLSEIIVGTENIGSNINNNFILEYLPFISIFFTSFVLFIRFILQIASIAYIRLNNSKDTCYKQNIIRLRDKSIAPFSFLSWIFINPDIYDENKLKEIIAHEHIHTSQYHSLDVLLAEAICILFWWNPFTWLIKKEIKINLEYLADQGVVNCGFDTKSYQYTLLQVSNVNTGMSIINNLNVSQLKKRITMMNKNKNSNIWSMKYLLTVPVSCFLLLAYATPKPISDLPIIHVALLNKNAKQSEEPYKIVDQLPEFEGGEKALLEYIKSNLKYPAEAVNAKIKGHVIVRFTVTKTGEVTDVVLLRGIDHACDKEAMRVVKEMPKWKPGKHKGEIVSVYYALPIQFKL